MSYNDNWYTSSVSKMLVMNIYYGSLCYQLYFKTVDGLEICFLLEDYYKFYDNQVFGGRGLNRRKTSSIEKGNINSLGSLLKTSQKIRLPQNGKN